MERDEQQPTSDDALRQWRAAEQAAAVARRGKLAATAAVYAADEVALAAEATAQAARLALDAATLSEELAAKTALAAKAAVRTAVSELVEVEAEVAVAEVGEARTRHAYRKAAESGAEGQAGGISGPRHTRQGSGARGLSSMRSNLAQRNVDLMLDLVEPAAARRARRDSSNQVTDRWRGLRDHHRISSSADRAATSRDSFRARAA